MEGRFIKLLPVSPEIATGRARLDRVIGRLAQRAPQVVGAQAIPLGSSPTASQRYDKTAASVFSLAHGKYTEASQAGVLFSACSGTGRAPGTALGTSPPILVYNPVGSNRRVSIKKVMAAQAATGTLGTGALYHCRFDLNGPVATQTGVVPVVGSGAALTPVNMDFGNAGTSVCTVFSLGTLNANPVLVYPAFQLGETVGGTTAIPTSPPCVEDVDGAIVLEPGSGWCLEAIAAAGSSPLVLCGVMWEEIQFV